MCNCRPTTKKRKTAEKNDDDDSDGIYSNTEVQTIVQSRLVARGLRFTNFLFVMKFLILLCTSEKSREDIMFTCSDPNSNDMSNPQRAQSDTVNSPMDTTTRKTSAKR